MRSGVPPGTVCKERFARYRGLKSLRDSEWDVKEGLPLPYSQIFSFADFKHSRAVARREGQGKSEADGWVAGERVNEVTLSLMDVDAEMAAALLKGAGPVVLFGLMAHEHKVSVTHCSMMRQAEWSAPIKAKEAMEVHCAFRRFTVQPIYSQQSNRPRALVERFFHIGRYTTASFYSRILYPPAPILMFRLSTTITCALHCQPHRRHRHPHICRPRPSSVEAGGADRLPPVVQGQGGGGPSDV